MTSNGERLIITFDESARKTILEAFDKAVDDDGYIVEKHSRERVLSQEGEEVLEKEFAGIKKGSEVFLKSDLTSLIKLCDELA